MRQVDAIKKITQWGFVSPLFHGRARGGARLPPGLGSLVPAQAQAQAAR